jgi:hypothetical protein
VASKLFVRRRDGRIEVRLSDTARLFVKEVASHVEAAEHDVNHDWHTSMVRPIEPTADNDDPLSILARQHETDSNAALCLASVEDEFITDVEAWSWLTTLQVGLRAISSSGGIGTEENFRLADPIIQERIVTLQMFLFALAEIL